ncbi:MAG TPA: adenylate kinase [Candidatus Omnitrophota bacterium]|nr:adenylate kinase [Candidatus Omnitrophota bacterium]HRZ15903.1 adenylate kinase [Candidatus Omnitrophota bacterium]
MRLVLLGAPGAGKGTHAKMLSKELKLPHVSTGDLLRSNVANNTPLGQEAQGYMTKGLLVPDELVTKMLTERFKQPDVQKGFILDGYPRTINQAKTLDRILAGFTMTIDYALNLEVSDETVIQRLSGRLVCRTCGANFHRVNMPPKREGICDVCGGELYQRADDKEETIKKRLTVYKNEVAALLEYYQTQKKLRTVSADKSVEQVLQAIVRLISPQ